MKDRFEANQSLGKRKSRLLDQQARDNKVLKIDSDGRFRRLIKNC